VRSSQSLVSSGPRPQQSLSRTQRVISTLTKAVLLAWVLYGAFLFAYFFFGPLALEKQISVSDSSLDDIPSRFHPHFAPHAANIRGEYSSVTRQCQFTYSCTQADFEALIERERLPAVDAKNWNDGVLFTGRQWGPGVVSYQFFLETGEATISASAW